MGIFWGSDPGGRIQGLRGLRLGFKGVRGGGRANKAINHSCGGNFQRGSSTLVQNSYREGKSLDYRGAGRWITQCQLGSYPLEIRIRRLKLYV